MLALNSLEMLGFGIKLAGKHTRKNILLSAGNLKDKETLFPYIQKLSKLNVALFATPGTCRFLKARGVECGELHKIVDKREPNISSFLSNDKLDLVINILTGNSDYDEASDCKTIRSMAIRRFIPLVTDVEVAVQTLDLILQQAEAAEPLRSDAVRTWDMRSEFHDLVRRHGGYACYHAHFDKAYLISLQNLRLSMVDMQHKWALYKYLKENYTHDDLVNRISRGVETMIAQGVTHCRTLVDADSTVKLLPVNAALEVKRKYADRIAFEIGVQPLQGVLDRESREYFARACERADLVGGLPSKDRPSPEKHLDVIMRIAKELNKKLDVHVDQENNPEECETELLARKTVEYGLEGRVSAIHAISVSAKPAWEQDKIVAMLKDAGVSVIVCPSAALSMKQLDQSAPLHNSIAPFAKLIEADVPVHLGVDNVYDLFMPLVDGDMWFECRLLMEAARFYDIDRVARIACDKSGFGASPIIKNASRETARLSV